MRRAFPLALLLAACASTPQTQAVLTPSPTSTIAAGPTQAVTVPDADREIVLWVVPAFAPDQETPAGVIFQTHLQEFEAAKQGVDVTVRVKAEKGVGGITEALLAANRAAPRALPDLVSLDSEGVQAAAEADLLTPLSEIVQPPEAYAFASRGARVDGMLFASPFASDMEAFAYEVSAFASPPNAWSSLLVGQSDFVIPAAELEALFVIAQYMSLGGELIDENDQVTVEVDLLADVLEFLASAAASGNLSLASLDLSSSGESWLALQEQRARAASAPFSAFMNGYDPRSQAAGPLPTQNGLGIALGKPWSWAVTRKAQDQETGELLEWLSEPVFQARWTEELGLLPTRPDVLAEWPDSPEAAVASRLASTAIAKPEASVLDTVGPPFRKAVQAVLSGSLEPAGAAAQAADEISGP